MVVFWVEAWIGLPPFTCFQLCWLNVILRPHISQAPLLHFLITKLTINAETALIKSLKRLAHRWFSQAPLDCLHARVAKMSAKTPTIKHVLFWTDVKRRWTAVKGSQSWRSNRQDALNNACNLMLSWQVRDSRQQLQQIRHLYFLPLRWVKLLHPWQRWGQEWVGRWR